MAAVNTPDQAPLRKPRADALRNQVRLLDTAKAVFAEKGIDASMDEIARAAGVGSGTLYRHFPNRDALIEAVYRNEMDQLAAAAAHLAETLPPIAALRAWMLLFVDTMGTKHVMATALTALPGGPAALYAASGAQVQTSIAMLTGNAVSHGDINLDIEPMEILRAIAAVASSGRNWQPNARKLVDILIAGLRAST
ncbi:TetR/AcrR family transcriptional regulator [Novosphingobium sp.]|uniref:TetR/AcrR family transcriptional regulator n=1 Tax=Novosphingobium sp. TaxID=1874826 RepID=UPI003B528AC9